MFIRLGFWWMGGRGVAVMGGVDVLGGGGEVQSGLAGENLCVGGIRRCCGQECPRSRNSRGEEDKATFMVVVISGGTACVFYLI